MVISHCYWHLVVKNGNFTLLLTSSGPEWQFHIANHVQWSKMTISHCYWHIVVKKGNFTLVLTYSGQEWQFDISTVRVHIGRSTGRSTPPIEHRFLEYHYTKLGTSHGRSLYIWAMHISMADGPPPVNWA